MVLCVARTFLSRRSGRERWNGLLQCKITNFIANNQQHFDFRIIPTVLPLPVSRVISAGDVKIITFDKYFHRTNTW